MENDKGQETALSLRLKTDELLIKIEAYLRGKDISIEYIQDVNSQIKMLKNESIVGKPILNDEGIQYIMSYLNSYINTAVVQGNIKKDEILDNIIFNLQVNLSHDLMNSLYTYELSEKNYEPLIDKIVDFVALFLTRALDNKERESLIPTIRQIDNRTIHSTESTNNGRGSILPNFGGSS